MSSQQQDPAALIREAWRILSQAVGRPCRGGCGRSLEGTRANRTYCGSEECYRKRNARAARKCRAANPEKTRKHCRKYQRKRRAANPEWDSEVYRKKFAANPEKIREQGARAARKRRAANPEKIREQGRANYHRRGGNGYNSAKNRAALMVRDGLRCDECGEWMDEPFDGKKTEVDHMWPVERGGGSELSNLRLLHAACHRPKGDKPVVRMLI